MGAQFDLSHINLVGYLTDETGLAAPRSDMDTIGKFLMSLAYGQNLISSTQGSPDDWTRQVADAANDQYRRLKFQFDNPANDRPIDSRRYLDPLRTYFTGYDFYALVLPTDNYGHDHSALRFFREAGFSSGTNGLVLLPSQPYGSRPIQFVDPFPVLRVLADQPIAPPGVLGRVRQGSLIAFVKLMVSATRLMVLFEVRTAPPQHGVGWVEPANVVYAVADRGRARAC